MILDESICTQSFCLYGCAQGEIQQGASSSIEKDDPKFLIS